MEYFAGLDVSLEETAICIVDETGRIVREARVVRGKHVVRHPGAAQHGGVGVGRDRVVAGGGVGPAQGMILSARSQVNKSKNASSVGW